MSTAALTTTETPKQEIVWTMVFFLIAFHIVGFMGFYYCFTLQLKWISVVYAYFLANLTMIGTTCGAHRLWCHRSYKAALPLRIFLALCQSLAYQHHLYGWVHNHRLHHKYTDTDADPHNAKRGLFYSHMGWLFVRRHPEARAKLNTIDMSDLEEDAVVMFQKKYYPQISNGATIILSTLVPWYCWGEDFFMAFCFTGLSRVIYTLHATWTVNSLAHKFGMKPYDRRILPSENALVSHLTCGEGWHNYHHSFPWDYKTSELHIYGLNFSTAFIDLMAKIGWAYDLKEASKAMIAVKMKKYGNGKSEIDFVEANNNAKQ